MAQARLYDLETGTFTLYDDGQPELTEPFAEPTLEYLKSLAVLEQKSFAHKLLRATDWYVIRSLELGVVAAPIPAVVTAYRSGVRTAADARCAVINAAIDKTALSALMDNQAAALTAAVQWPSELDSQYTYYS